MSFFLDELGWIYNNGYCYMFTSYHVTFLRAEELCNEVVSILIYNNGYCYMFTSYHVTFLSILNYNKAYTVTYLLVTLLPSSGLKNYAMKL